MLVHQILKAKATQGVQTVPPETTVAQAAETLSERRFGSLIVSKDGDTALGILSERDIVRELGKRGTGCLKDTVAEMMTKKVVSCAPDETALGVLEIMTDGRFRHMPVMQEGKMIGLISIGDVVKARLAELAMEKDALEGMIMGH